MLNRRILRVKAMQALYGYFTAVESLKEVSRMELQKVHALDPAKHDFSEKAHFESRKALAVKLFNDFHLSGEVPSDADYDTEVIENVNNEIESFTKKVKFEAKNKKSEMIKDAYRIYDSYLKMLQLLIELQHHEKQESDRKPGRIYPLIDHPELKVLIDFEQFQKEVTSRNISWANEVNEIRTWYKKEIRTSEVLQDYFESKGDPKSLLKDIIKKVIFKNEEIVNYLESGNIQWSENQSIIKSMVLKTLKSLDTEEPELAELTKNGKEDFDFLEIIFKGVIDRDEQLQEQVSGKTDNWEVERIALTDLILLKMAIVEMTSCPSIPTKVTINEVIEISKQYSTPKSKQFINGVLDVLSNELTSTGKVRKSGRGLIDNR